MNTAATDPMLATVIQFALIMVRFTSIFVFSPILGRQQVPNLLKIGFSVMCSFIFINVYPPSGDVYPYNEMIPLLGALLSELAVGLVIGFVTLLFFNIVYTAGHIIDMQIGFSMAQVYDVTTGGQVAVTASLLNVMFVVSFVFQDGISMILYLFGRTFALVPVGTAVLQPDTLWMLAELFARCFALSLQISMPLLAAALLAEVALGVIVRTAPQMNVFVVGIPLKVIIGLIMLLAMIPVFVNITGEIFDEMYRAIEALIGGFTADGA